MSNEILTVLEYMEKEKSISRPDMIAAIVNAIKTAAQKGINAGQELKIEIDPKTGKLRAWALLKVVDSVANPKTEIHLEKARPLKPSIQLGDIFERDIDPAMLGRIAAQTARQAVVQRVRQFEKDRIYDDFKDQIGNIVTGVVRRRERGDIYVDLGKAEALLSHKEQIHGEEYMPGDRVRCILLEIEATPRGPEIILSRASQKFVRRLFELEVTEIADGTVKIETFARDPGYRTKISVSTTDPKVDPVGACVGARGARVKTIVRELNGEKIDIIPYHADIKQFIVEALKPAIPRDMVFDKKNNRVSLKIDTESLAIAIGRRGQNARLTSRLVGWKLDIDEYAPASADPRETAIQTLVKTLALARPIAERLVNIGMNSVAVLQDVEEKDLLEAGFTAQETANIFAKLKK